MFGFVRQNYRIRVDGHCVYVKWNRSVAEWPEQDVQAYLPKLRAAVQKSVDPKVWQLLCEHNRSGDELYQEYFGKVLAQFIQEYGLDIETNDVSGGLWHGDMLVISFRAKQGPRYPYYYRGIQVHPNLTE
jgi:hypothetical protein